MEKRKRRYSNDEAPKDASSTGYSEYYSKKENEKEEDLSSKQQEFLMSNS